LKELTENLLLDAKEQLPSYAADLLLEKLGVSEWMQDTPCNRQSSQYNPNNNGWKSCMLTN
jgi:hypothetical protein